MGVLGFADTNYEELSANDHVRAAEFDEMNKLARQSYVESVAELGATAAE